MLRKIFFYINLLVFVSWKAKKRVKKKLIMKKVRAFVVETGQNQKRTKN